LIELNQKDKVMQNNIPSLKTRTALRRLFGATPVLIGLSVYLGALGGLHAAGDLWTVDFEAAKKSAAQEDKGLLLEFTGSDWCPPCKSLKKKVLDSQAFKEALPKDYVLVKLDFPRDKSNQTQEEIQQNQQLQEKFQISGFPTIILADAEGRPFYQKVGYGGTPANDYIQDLLDQRDRLKNRNEAFEKAEQSSGLEKAKWLDEGLQAIDSQLQLTGYGEQIENIIKLDADNEAGLKAKYKSRLELPQIKQQMEQIMSEVGNGEEQDYQQAIDRIEQLIEEKEPSGEALQEVLFAKSFLIFQQGNQDEARQGLEAALEAAPESNRAEQIRSVLGNVFGNENP
jgi:thioredoxin-related protein